MFDITPLVSAVIPTYNRAASICRAIDSLFAQSRLPDEIIVVDDGSTDGTSQLLRARYGNKIRIIEQPNGGVAAARRSGIENARGKWIAFLDSDDEWFEHHLRDLLSASENVPPDIAWIFGDTMTATDKGDTQSLFAMHRLKLASEPHVFDDSLAVQFPFQFGLFQSSIIRRDVLLKLDCFAERLRSNDDLLAGFQVACKYRFAATSAVVTRLDRTSGLRKGAVEIAGRYSLEHYLSRQLAFALCAQTQRRGPWATAHADAVRGLCLKRAERGESIFRTSFEQLRFGISLKAIAFIGCAMFGQFGIRFWNRTRNKTRASLSLEPGAELRPIA